MDNALNNKIRKVEEDHADGLVKGNLSEHNQARRDAANRYIGGAMAIDRLKEHLASQVIMALMTVEEEKLYLEFGFATFAEFLDNHEFSTMSKSSFYRARDLFISEGATKFDLLTEWGISSKLRKQLQDGDIVIEGDEVIIGGQERVAIGESPKLVKAILERLVEEKHNLGKDLEKAEGTIEKQADKIKKGSAEVNELQRAIDSINESTPFERALMGTVKAMITLTSEVKALPDDERAERADADLKTMAEQWFQLRDAYGVKVPFSERPADGPANDFEAKLAAAIAEPDDLDDEGVEL